MNLTKIFTITGIAFGLVSHATAANPTVNVNAQGTALEGNDPVAFFADKKAESGNPTFSSEYNGAKYLFASEEHKQAFDAEPDKYAPKYGGFCAFGVSVGKKLPVQINTWQVVDDHLYLNYNKDVEKKFKKDVPGNIAKAEKNWPAGKGQKLEN